MFEVRSFDVQLCCVSEMLKLFTQNLNRHSRGPCTLVIRQLDRGNRSMSQLNVIIGKSISIYFCHCRMQLHEQYSNKKSAVNRMQKKKIKGRKNKF